MPPTPKYFFGRCRGADVDAFSIWHDRRFTDNLASPEGGIIFLGGSWLEEEILIAALQAAERGYDVRLLSDVIAAPTETDRSLVFNRLALHGILATTVRQTLLEWAVHLHDPLFDAKNSVSVAGEVVVFL
ncbi:hypothetical protein ACFIOY_20025 [Bradyrhizobium sp. TZ2]